jgi:hypothetical protein
MRVAYMFECTSWAVVISIVNRRSTMPAAAVKTSAARAFTAGSPLHRTQRGGAWQSIYEDADYYSY